MNTLTFAAHVVYLAPLSGDGLLVRPLPSDDLDLPGSPYSLHAVDWDARVTRLFELDWELSEESDGEPIIEGRLADGREVLGLIAREPIDVYDFEASARAFAELRELAGVVRA